MTKRGTQAGDTQGGPGRPTGIDPSGNGGFTLVEVMVSVAILGMVFGSTFALLGQSFLLVEKARDYTRASQIMQSEMENLRTLNWSDLEDLPALAEFEPESRFVSNFAERYTCTRAITLRESRPDQKQVVLTIAWDDRWGRPHERNYITFFTQEGLNDYYYRSL